MRDNQLICLSSNSSTLDVFDAHGNYLRSLASLQYQSIFGGTVSPSIVETPNGDFFLSNPYEGRFFLVEKRQ